MGFERSRTAAPARGTAGSAASCWELRVALLAVCHGSRDAGAVAQQPYMIACIRQRKGTSTSAQGCWVCHQRPAAAAAW